MEPYDSRVPGAPQPAMRTRTVRIYERDLDRIRQPSGLSSSCSFATATEVVVDRVSQRGPATVEDVRAIVREELHDGPDDLIEGAAENRTDTCSGSGDKIAVRGCRSVRWNDGSQPHLDS